MRKSEMEKLLLNGLCDLGQWYDMAPEAVAEALCLLLRPKEGWEPEELRSHRTEWRRSIWVLEIARIAARRSPVALEAEFFLPAAEMAAEALTVAGLEWQPEELPLPSTFTQDAAPPEVLAAYESLRRFFLGSGV